MADQLDIHGNAQPLTWDREPLYSPSTIAEGLFDPHAFQQMPGQTCMGVELEVPANVKIGSWLRDDATATPTIGSVARRAAEIAATTGCGRLAAFQVADYEASCER